MLLSNASHHVPRSGDVFFRPRKWALSVFLGSVTQGKWSESIFDGTHGGPGFCSPSGGKGKKGGGKGKDCRAPQDDKKRMRRVLRPPGSIEVKKRYPLVI